MVNGEFAKSGWADAGRKKCENPPGYRSGSVDNRKIIVGGRAVAISLQLFISVPLNIPGNE